MNDLKETMDNMEYKVKKKERELEAEFLKQNFLFVQEAETEITDDEPTK